ncbi:hypothetical protein PVAND_002355 [Polypedilum vanderplanki]|uniref:Phospholipase A-2-activating protein n=1 Tax=Polypedilum vanderplanki TaxID=319348 RepID=A0A9J6BRX7_POLVA|nr:hypothetical protein PVAND_002355 [Polypedilum vanderplanki]
MEEFKLSAELSGHSLDVRAVTYANNCIISGSRDKTARIFERTDDGKNFKQTEVLTNHSNFVSSVCVLNDGNWLATASNDKTICLYNFGIVQPFATLKEHTSTVCSLAQGLESKILISGSWDQTARIWNNLDIDSSSIELNGHEAAVWAVCTLKNGKYATGSADKNIFVWNTRGEKLVVLKGHTDCVRALAALDDGSLLSASNDATIRHWSDTYDCIKEFHGHANYIYSIALNPALGDLFVTGSEDNTIRLWSVSKGALGDAIYLPAQSVWAVACADNGDIITGSSDALVRVFTKDPSRMASEETISAFETAVATRKLEQSKELGGIKVNDLPGPESLLQVGSEGQTRLVRQPDGKILCYQWTKGKWECVGDVMGAAGGTQQTSGKSLHEGKEYDYVFNVDIEDGKPPIKLPFNVTEDPWMAAQKFIHKNDLPQVYLEQVANFIIKNASLTTMPVANESFADPFTGGGRYVPSSNGNNVQSSSNNVNVNFRERTGGNSGAINLDPFTGGSSYSSGKRDLIVQKHIPCLNLSTFDAFDGSKILAKLKEFNNQLEDENLKVTDTQIDSINQLFSNNVPDDETIKIFKKLLQWPNDKLFPLLDILRLGVRNKIICEKLASIDYVIDKISTTAANQLMSIRALSNMLIHEYGKNSVEVKIINICESISKISQGSSNLQNAIATFFLNQSILQKDVKSEEVCTILLLELLRALDWISDPEATFKSYAAIGNLITFNSSATVSIIKSTENFKNSLERNRSAQYEKLAEISNELTEKLL